MHNDVFQNANQVFKGQPRRSKNEGRDTSKPHSDMAPHDLEKLYNCYFTPGLHAGNTEILMHKVFIDIMYHTGRRAKEGLGSLTKNSFDLKLTPEGKEYTEINFNETTKKNQGDNTSSAAEILHNNHAIIVEQEGDPYCTAFFQHPVKNKTGYENKPIGKNTLGSLMKTISDNEHAKLSKIHTNHCICKTTATGMHCQGYFLKEIANVTKHKNLQSGALHRWSDKEDYSTALFQYSKNKENEKRKQEDEVQVSHKKQKIKPLLQQRKATGALSYHSVKMSYKINCIR